MLPGVRALDPWPVLGLSLGLVGRPRLIYRNVVMIDCGIRSFNLDNRYIMMH